MKRWMLLVLALFVTAGFAGAWHLGFFAPPFSAVAQNPIQRIELVDLAGKRQSFDALQGDATALYFFTSWCAPCYKTLNTLQQLSEEYDFEVRLLAVAVDDDIEGIRDMLDTTGFKGEVWLAVEGTQALQRRYFGNERRAIPYVVRLDANTSIVESTYEPSDAQWQAILVDGHSIAASSQL